MNATLDACPVGWDRFVAAGVTYRQLLVWTHKGLIHPTENPKGSGFALSWPSTEVPVAARIARLRTIGVNLDVAERVARGWGTAVPGITITLDDSGCADA